jgi:hypothetical protein
MKFCRLSTLAVCVSLSSFHATADDGDIDFIPPTEIPVDATMPQNVRSSRLDHSATKSSEQWLSPNPSAVSKKNDAVTSFKPAEQAQPDGLGANLMELQKKVREQKELELRPLFNDDKKKEADGTAKSNTSSVPNDSHKPFLFSTFRSDSAKAPQANPWDTWVNDDAEFNAKVAAVVEGTSVTNGEVLLRYALYLRSVRADFRKRHATDPAAGPKAYIDLRSSLVKRDLPGVLVNKGFALRLTSTLTPQKLDEIRQRCDAEFTKQELPRMLREAQVENAEEFEKLFPEFSNCISTARDVYATTLLAQRFCALHSFFANDPDQPLRASPPNFSQWVSGTLRYDDGTAVVGAMVSSFWDVYSGIRIEEEDGEKSNGSFDCSIPGKQACLLVDFREASGWPHESVTSDNANTQPQKAVVDSLLVRRFSDRTIAKRDIVVPRSKWGSLTLNWQGDTERKLLTVFVTPFQGGPAGKIADALAPATTGEQLDTYLRYVRSFPILLEKDKKIVIPNLPPGRCVVVVQQVLGGSPQIQTTVLPDSAELTFDPLERGAADVRVDGRKSVQLGSLPANSSRDFFRDMATGFRFLRDVQIGAVDQSAQPASIEPRAEKTTKLEYELRLVGSDWDTGFLLWSSSKGDARTLIVWNPERDVLYPGRYALIVRDGSRSKRYEFTVHPSEKTAVNVRSDELTDPNAVDANEDVLLFR